MHAPHSQLTIVNAAPMSLTQDGEHLAIEAMLIIRRISLDVLTVTEAEPKSCAYEGCMLGGVSGNQRRLHGVRGSLGLAEGLDSLQCQRGY